MKHYLFGLMILLIGGVFILGGCTDSAPSGPTPGLGGNTINKYVSVGNSITGGAQDNSWFAEAQEYSFPNLIAKQLVKSGAGIGTFQQPLWSNDGLIPTDRMKLKSLDGPDIIYGSVAGAPINIGLARPYDNLGIPGATLYDFLNAKDSNTCASAVLGSPSKPNPLFSYTLRGLGSQFSQTVNILKPDLVTFWLGNNDVLGFATSGGVSPSAPTPKANFAALYKQALDSLKTKLPNAKILVANIPEIKTLPFFTTVGPVMAQSLPAGYYLRYQKHGNTSVAYDSTRLTETGAPLITLKGKTYAGELGKPSGLWYRDLAKMMKAPVAAVIGAGIDTTKPFGFHPQNPWPDMLALDAAEQTTASTAVADFNAIIAAEAAAHSFVLVDAYSVLNQIATTGYPLNGAKYTAAYLTGGVFSLDGVHPSSRGCGIIANEFIKVMNSKYGMTIPLIDVSAIPGIPVLGKYAAGNRTLPDFRQGLFDNTSWLWGN